MFHLPRNEIQKHETRMQENTANLLTGCHLGVFSLGDDVGIPHVKKKQKTNELRFL